MDQPYFTLTSCFILEHISCSVQCNTELGLALRKDCKGVVDINRVEGRADFFLNFIRPPQKKRELYNNSRNTLLFNWQKKFIPYLRKISLKRRHAIV